MDLILNNSSNRIITLKGSVFIRKECDGDYDWMVNQEEFDECLFGYNDDWFSFCENITTPGFGSSIIRPRRFGEIPRAFCIPNWLLVGVRWISNIDR